MAELYLSEILKRKLQVLITYLEMNPSINSKLLEEFQQLRLQDSISIKYLEDFYMLYDKTFPNEYSSLQDFIKSSKLIFPSFRPVVKEVSDELIQRRIFLKVQQESRDYNKMMYGSENNPNEEKLKSLGANFRSTRNELSIILNMVYSTLAMLGIGYYLSKQMKLNDVTSLSIGLMCAIAIMFIEMILFISRSLRLEQIDSSNHEISQKDKFIERSSGLRSNTYINIKAKNE